jgi:outer membrane protein OmpA-like peptidoglycan-associated protein
MERNAKQTWCTFLIATLLSLLVSCSYNPFISENHETGSPLGAAIGAGVGGGSIALLGGTRPYIGFGALVGGVVGYYVTTLRYDSGGVIQGGGLVYKVGDFIGIYIPSDNLFEPNTAEFLPQAGAILDSVAAILHRYPNHNVLVSGNTSGFYCPRWEQQISERRAQKVSAYLWNAGIGIFKNETGTDLRQLNYVGYGDYFPIASTLTNTGIRQNSRVQITAYPSSCDLLQGKREVALHNMGELVDDDIYYAPDCRNGRC